MAGTLSVSLPMCELEGDFGAELEDAGFKDGGGGDEGGRAGWGDGTDQRGGGGVGGAIYGGAGVDGGEVGPIEDVVGLDEDLWGDAVFDGTEVAGIAHVRLEDAGGAGGVATGEEGALGGEGVAVEDGAGGDVLLIAAACVGEEGEGVAVDESLEEAVGAVRDGLVDGGEGEAVGAIYGAVGAIEFAVGGVGDGDRELKGVGFGGV